MTSTLSKLVSYLQKDDVLQFQNVEDARDIRLTITRAGVVLVDEKAVMNGVDYLITRACNYMEAHNRGKI